jgi:uncharacterized repeat protein (TIGR03806 family)
MSTIFRNKYLIQTLLCFVICIISNACKQKIQTVQVTEENYSHSSIEDVKGLKKLSDYGLFEFPLAEIKPKVGVIPYDLNSSLFTDYAFKKRFIYLPKGTAMTYHEDRAFDFPEGSLIFKFFYYPKDFRQPEKDLQHVETRVLIRENNDWTALTYIWDESQNDAHLTIAGETKSVAWKDEAGKNQSVNYSVPNLIQCKSCHEYAGKMMPIGPAARHLNKPYAFASTSINQLDHLISSEKLKGIESAASCPKIVDYTDKSVSTDDRARAYLDINCAHCHRPEGPAKNSALNLLASEKNPIAYGVMKTPIAAGIGSGGLKYDIVPGKPDQSILHYRMNSLQPGVAMPELGRKMAHGEGLALIADWINEMK